MATCLWHKCGADFEPRQTSQKFCQNACKDAHNNWLKMTGIHLVPRALDYVQGLADAREIPIDEMANEMILKMANADGKPLDDEEMYGGGVR